MADRAALVDKTRGSVFSLICHVALACNCWQAASRKLHIQFSENALSIMRCQLCGVMRKKSLLRRTHLDINDQLNKFCCIYLKDQVCGAKDEVHIVPILR